MLSGLPEELPWREGVSTDAERTEAAGRHAGSSEGCVTGFLGRSFLLACCLVLWPGINAEAAPAPTKKLSVGVTETAPFAMKNAVGDWEGIGVDLWRAIAKKLHLSYEFVQLPEPDLLPWLQSGKVDVVAGGFVITPEKEGAIEFGQVYYAADQAMGAPRHPIRHPIAVAVEAFLSWQFLKVVLPALALFFLVGLIMYLIERSGDPMAYGGGKARSLLRATFWSTAMAAGPGAEMPRSSAGRVIAIVWILIGLSLTSLFTAAMTRMLTADLFSREMPQERSLLHSRVSVLAGTDLDFLRVLGVRLLVFSSPREAIGAAVKGEADFCVLSEPVLKYYAGKDFKGRIEIAPIAGRKTLYAFGLSPNSPLRKPLNVALLQLIESPEGLSILQQYLSY
jgi:polar amino acid transport system substrate-binding protein